MEFEPILADMYISDLLEEMNLVQCDPQQFTKEQINQVCDC